MKRLFLISFLLTAISNGGFAQLTDLKVKLIDNSPKVNSGVFNKKSATAPQSCGRDTVQYPRLKASSFTGISVKKNYSLGQFYGAPQDITVHGFSFYAWVVASNPPADNRIRLICNIYKAGKDSLPSGSPIQSDTITIDTTFGGGVLTKLLKHATFKKPVNLNFPYILTVESDSANLNAGLVSNSYANNDGDGTNYLCGSVSGKWYRGMSLNISGTDLNCDMQFYPHVSYKFGTDFTIPTCYDFKDTARFKNQYRSNVSGSYFYNAYSFFNYDWFCHQWNYGEYFWDTYEEEGLYTYQGRGNYNIRLISKVYQWHPTNGTYTVCADTTTKILYFKPKDPVVLGSTNICRGDSANILVASDTGTIIEWYDNPSASKPVFTGNYNRLGVPQVNDTFYIKAINYACESNFSTIIISVNDYPKDPIITNDSICLGARANLGAKSNTGITEWFTDTTRLPVYTGNVLLTDPLSKDVTYFVRSNNRSCLSTGFKTVTAYVNNNFAPDEPTTTKDTNICLRPVGKALLKAYNSANDSIFWYSVANGGKSIAQGNTYQFTPSSKGETIIYVEASQGGCASSRLPIKITTGDYPSVTSIFSDERCKGDTAQVGVLLSSFGQVNWFTTASGGKPVGNGYVIRYLTKNTINLYAQAEDNGCINPNRSVVNIKINAYDTITKIDVPLICGSQAATLKVTAGGSTINWYEDADLTQKLSTGATYTTPKLLVSTNYYFTVSKNGCTSPVNTAFVEVIPLPVAGYNYDFLPGHKLRLTPTASSGVSYLWKMGDGKTYTTKFVTHSYALYGTYNVKLIVTSVTSDCKDSTSQDIVYDFSGIKPAKIHNVKVVPNPNKGAFKIVPPAGVVNGTLSIINTEGQLVYQTKLDGDKELNLDTNLSAGLYTIKIDWNQNSAQTRLMVQ
jgi:hypothetical protein